MQGDRPLNDNEIDNLLQRVKRGKFGNRNACFVQVGLYTGFRISELLSLRIQDVVQPNGQILDFIYIARKHMKRKTASRTAIMTDEPREAIALWLVDLRKLGWMRNEDYLFQSNSPRNQAISRSEAYHIIHRAARECGMTGKIGTHSLRKTYADRMYKELLKRKGPDDQPLDVIRGMQAALGHKDMDSTVKYLASFQEGVLKDASRSLSFGTKGKQVQMGLQL